MKGLTGKIAIVTGASRGIGAGIARKLAAEGATVVACSTKPDGCAATVEAIRAAGGVALALGVDVSSAAEVDACVKDVVSRFGRIDILVNNAGITRDGLLMRMSDEDWGAVIDTNLKGTFLFTRAVSRPMMKNKTADGAPAGGAIVNISSVVGITGNAGQANYAASKGGVIALTKTTAKELGSRNIRCNAIAPGFVQTQMTESLSEAVKANCLSAIPLKRFGTVEDIADAVAWLVDDESSYVTGQVIAIDGGMIC